MEKLVSTYLDGDIPKDIYLKRKDKTMRSLATLKEKKKACERRENTWVEPLREWVLDTKQAAFLSSSDNFSEIASFVQKIGTNHAVRDKTARFSVPAPSHFVAKRRGFLPSRAPAARGSSALCEREVSFCAHKVRATSGSQKPCTQPHAVSFRGHQPTTQGDKTRTVSLLRLFSFLVFSIQTFQRTVRRHTGKYACAERQEHLQLIFILHGRSLARTRILQNWLGVISMFWFG